MFGFSAWFLETWECGNYPCESRATPLQLKDLEGNKYYKIILVFHASSFLLKETTSFIIERGCGRKVFRTCGHSSDICAKTPTRVSILSFAYTCGLGCWNCRAAWGVIVPLPYLIFGVDFRKWVCGCCLLHVTLPNSSRTLNPQTLRKRGVNETL